MKVDQRVRITERYGWSAAGHMGTVIGVDNDGTPVLYCVLLDDNAGQVWLNLEEMEEIDDCC